MAKDTYNLAPSFERALVRLCATRPKFYANIGHALDFEALNQSSCALLLKAVKAIAKDLGNGPSEESVVLQRLQRWQEEGSITKEQIDEVADIFIDAPATDPDEPQVVAEIVPILRRRLQAGAVKMAMEEYSKKGDFDEVIRIITKAKRLGLQNEALGLRMGSQAFAEINRLRHVDRLPTGILELDVALDGGLPRGCMNMWVGGAGAGKSTALVHQARTGVFQGYFAVVATLEIGEAAWSAKLVSNITGVPVNTILEGESHEAEKILEKLSDRLGTCLIKEFPATATTMLDIRDWVKQCEDSEGAKVDLVIIDYADKLASHDKNDKSQYDAQRTICESFRLYCHETKKWGVTASQAVRRGGKDKNRRVELDDAADSQHKVRVTDMVITLTASNDGDQILYNVAKNRYGRAGFAIGPLPHDFSRSRMVPLLNIR